MNSGGAGHSGKATDPRPQSGLGGRVREGSVPPPARSAEALRVFHF